MAVNLREVITNREWEVISAGLGASEVISTHADRAEAVEAGINYKLDNPAAWVVITHSENTYVIVDSV